MECVILSCPTAIQIKSEQLADVIRSREHVHSIERESEMISDRFSW